MKKGKLHLILNRIRTPDGTILTSYHQHDYASHLDKNGEIYVADGGNEYQRCSINKEPFEDLSVWSSAPFEVIRESYHLGGRGKDGLQPLIWVPLSKMSNEWLINCIKHNDECGLSKSDATCWYFKELRYRKKWKYLLRINMGKENNWKCNIGFHKTGEIYTSLTGYSYAICTRCGKTILY